MNTQIVPMIERAENGIPLTQRPAFPERPTDAHSADGYVYIVEFSDSTTKVGRTDKPSNRLEQHRHDGRKFGLTIVRWWVSDIHRNNETTEKSLKAFAKTAGSLQGGSEYFTCLDFDAAVAHVKNAGVMPSTASEAQVDNERRAASIEASKAFWSSRQPKGLTPVMVEEGISGVLALFLNPTSAMPDLSGETSPDVQRELIATSRELSELTGRNADEILEWSWLDLLGNILDNVVSSAKMGLELRALNEGRGDLLAPCFDQDIS